MIPYSDDLKILIIDDNPQIHKDFIKILSINTSNKSRLNKLEKDIFENGSEDVPNCKLPKFLIDVASQGQEGIKKSLKR